MGTYGIILNIDCWRMNINQQICWIPNTEKCVEAYSLEICKQ